jgi:2-polyprenyl-3-methyl-5-hydroxy-6-metoxy-1,4-benzoquinol methylase
MLKYIPKDAKRILEVGCGEGFFLAQIKENIGAETWGVEMNPLAAENASKVIDKVFTGDYNQLYKELPQHTFDCVIFNDVIEHFLDPWQALINTQQLLSENGVIVSSIPNFIYIGNLTDIISHADFRYREEGGFLDKTHLRFFTSKSIYRLFEESGYEIVSQEGSRPCKSWKEKLLLFLSFGFLEGLRYKSFASIAKVKK